jgi:hypothetical protein
MLDRLSIALRIVAALLGLLAVALAVWTSLFLEI